MRQRCLVIGASGQLGRALCSVFQKDAEVVRAYRVPLPGQRRMDLSDPAGMLKELEEIRPHWILIAGAFCNVDLAQSQRQLCFKVNVEGPRTLCEYAARSGSVVVYYSTDQVFDGTLSTFHEEAPVHPLNAYAQSKVEGEKVVRETLPRQHLILRTTGLYGPDLRRRNFILRLVDQLSKGEGVRVAEDLWGMPTYTEDLACVTQFLLDRDERGTFHATGPELMKRTSLALQACRVFKLDSALLIPTATADLKQPAQRPLRVPLSGRKLKMIGAPCFRNVQEGLQNLFQWQGSSKTDDSD